MPTAFSYFYYSFNLQLCVPCCCHFVVFDNNFPVDNSMHFCALDRGHSSLCISFLVVLMGIDKHDLFFLET
jgi:hypothetical protein